MSFDDSSASVILDHGVVISVDDTPVNDPTKFIALANVDIAHDRDAARNKSEPVPSHYNISPDEIDQYKRRALAEVLRYCIEKAYNQTEGVGQLDCVYVEALRFEPRANYVRLRLITNAELNDGRILKGRVSIFVNDYPPESERQIIDDEGIERWTIPDKSRDKQVIVYTLGGHLKQHDLDEAIHEHDRKLHPGSAVNAYNISDLLEILRLKTGIDFSAHCDAPLSAEITLLSDSLDADYLVADCPAIWNPRTDKTVPSRSRQKTKRSQKDFSKRPGSATTRTTGKNDNDQEKLNVEARCVAEAIAGRLLEEELVTRRVIDETIAAVQLTLAQHFKGANWALRLNALKSISKEASTRSAGQIAETKDLTRQGTRRIRRRMRSREELGGDPNAENYRYDVKLGARVYRDLRDEFIDCAKRNQIPQRAALTEALKDYLKKHNRHS